MKTGSESRQRCQVLAPTTSSKLIGDQRLTTVGPRRLLSQSYSVLDGFNLEQLVDDEPIHMVFKSLSVPEAINLQDTLRLSSTLTDSTVQNAENIPNTRN